MDIILNTFGVSLNRDNEGFVIVNQDGRQRIPALGIRSIQIGKGAQITSDAVMLAIDNEIEVVFTDRSGQPKGRIWSPKYGSISTIRKGQLAFTNSVEAVKWIKDVLAQKVSNQQALLLMLPEPADTRLENKLDSATNKLEDYRQKILQIPTNVIIDDVASALRGLEGSASRIYFATISEFIPQAYKFEGRSQHPALDIFNALLNYGYGILYSRIEGELIKAGIDPYIGILHRDEYNRPVLVYDVIELYRIWIDYVVCNLTFQQVITDEFYSIQSDGSYWLETLGRKVLIQSINDYLEEVIQVNGNSRSKATQIQLFVQGLAQTFKKFQ
ncbi:MAG: CRISPR-associated endonuclease Cas1 [Bacteroidales bacterium]|nr:CRISPR-associated endonuclease Cas1 [Bacteroidales bacterium]